MQYVECRGGEVIRVSAATVAKMGVLAPFVDQKEEGTTREHPIPLDVTQEDLTKVLNRLRDNVDPYLDIKLYYVSNYLSIPVTDRVKQIRDEIKQIGDEVACFRGQNFNVTSKSREEQCHKIDLRYSDATPEYYQLIQNAVVGRLDHNRFPVQKFGLARDELFITPINVIVKSDGLYVLYLYEYHEYGSW